MNKHSVVFIDLPENERLEKPSSRARNSKLSQIFSLSRELPRRICMAFVPPIFGSRSRIIYVDPLGPFLAVLILSILLLSGHSRKHPRAALTAPPLLVLALYLVSSPVLCFVLGRFGHSFVKLRQITALVGYGLYGHVATLLGSQLLGGTSSNTIFLVLLTIFGGSSALKIALVFLVSIPRPAARLLVCTIIVLVHILFLIFLHYAYVHETFMFNGEIIVSNKL